MSGRGQSWLAAIIVLSIQSGADMKAWQVILGRGIAALERVELAARSPGPRPVVVGIRAVAQCATDNVRREA